MRFKIRILALVLCLAGMCLSAGCFDYEVALRLKEDGKSTLGVSLTLPQGLARGQQARQLDTIVRPLPSLSKRVKGTNLILQERVDLDYLDLLSARRVLFEVDTIGTGVLGMTDYTYRVVAKLAPSDGDLPERTVMPGTELEKRKPKASPAGPAAARARRLLAATLGGHHVTMTFVVPGKVVKSWPLVLGGSKIDPKITDQGKQISWEVPLAVLINENIRHTLVFRADFKGEFEFRLPGQKSMKSRHPTAEDEKLVAEDLKRMRKEKLEKESQDKAEQQSETKADEKSEDKTP